MKIFNALPSKQVSLEKRIKRYTAKYIDNVCVCVGLLNIHTHIYKTDVLNQQILTNIKLDYKTLKKNFMSTWQIKR